MQLRCSLCHRELLEHARLHGEELAAIHQQNLDVEISNSKSKLQQVSISEGSKFYKLHIAFIHLYGLYTGHLLQFKCLL